MDKRICVYPAGETDFASNGLGCLSPTRCKVHWAMDGEYELEIEHPIDLGAGDWGKYERLCAYGRTVVAPVPEAPSMALRQTGATATVSLYAIATRKSRLRLRSGPGTSYRCLGYYAKGRKVTLLAKTSDDWYEVTAPDGKHGWMAARYLTAAGTRTVSSVTTEILRDLPMRPQPFDIYAFDPGLSAVTARARHVFWRLAENLVCELEIKDKTAQQALDAAFAAALNQNHGFHWHCEDTEKRSMEKMTGRTLADVILGDGGICETYGLHLLADWFDVFLVKELGARRGVQLRYGKNVAGLSGGYDVSNVVTRVVPVGQTKDGNPLYRSGDRWIASEHESLYPRPVYGYLDVSEAKVGSEVDGKKLTTATARSLMDKRAREQLDGGCDLPDCSLTAKMAQLRYDPAYEQYADLERVCPGDTLSLFLPDYGLTLDATLSEYTFDAISQRYEDLTLGSPRQNLSSSGVTSRQLGRGSVTGSKLAYASVGASALSAGAVSAQHLQADSINAQALQAGSVTTEKLTAGSVTAEKLAAAAVTAEKLDAGSVTAEKLSAGSVTAEKLAADSVTTEKLDAESVTAEKLAAGSVRADKLAAGSVTAEKLAAGAVTADKLDAGSVTTEKLAAGAVTAEKIASKTITSDLIAAKTITAESGIIDDAAIGTMQIADGSITSAKIVSLNADVINAGTLSAERLVLVGDDGVIYKINAASSGLSMSELAKDEYKNYINGTVIVAKSITAAQIAAQTITGNEILAGSITAKEIDVADLFASSATIQALNAMDIRGNTYLQLYVTDALDDLSIGGTNLLLNSKSAVDAGYNIASYMPSSPLVEGETYTASVCLTPANGVTNIDAFLSEGWAHQIRWTLTETGRQILTKTFVAHYYDGRTPEDKASNARLNLYRIPNDGSVTGGTTVHWAKVEKGNKATDWSPAPEDVQDDVDALETRMSEAELKITSDAIVSTVTSSESYKTLSNTASAAKSAASTAQSTADTAKANAATAQSTANTAKSASETNASDISGLKTRMTTAESEILQKADSITLSVLQTQVDGISVGGRNYVLDSAGPFSLQGVDGTTVTKLKYGPSAEAVSSLFGKEVTVSADYDNQVSSGRCLFNFHTAWTGITVFTASNSGTGHIKRTLTLPSVETNTSSALIYLQGDFTGSITLTNIKVELGNKATDWSPAPEDPAGSLSVSSDYSKVDIDSQRVRIVSKQMEVAVPSDDGEDDVLRVDADGVHAEVVEADTIVSDSVVHTQEAITYTPSSSGGLAAILDELSGKHLTSRVYVNCQNITSGSFEISNLTGGGSLTFLNGTMNALKVFGCGSTAVYASGTAFSTAGTALTLDGSSMVYLSGCKINAGVGFDMGTNWPAIAFVSSCSGDCTKLAQLKAFSVLRFKGASKPTGTLDLADGCEVYNATGDPNFAAAASPSIPTTQTVTTTLSPTSTYTLRGTSNSDGNKLYQGRYSSSQGMRKGVMLFTLPSDLTAADNIDSAVLTIKRISGAGQGGGVPVQIRCFDQTGTLYASATAYGGQTVSVDVTSAVKAMKTNGYTGLMLYNPSTTTASGKSYTTSYARFAGKGESGAPVLKISYRK